MPKKTPKPTSPSAESTPARAPAAFTAQDLRRLIADLHGLVPAERKLTLSEEWALFFELRNGTGHGRQDRYVDAFAFNLYPSKKHWRVAYEIKVSRGDFLSELKKPEKRAFAFDISNEFWYACAPGVAKPEEIPEGCGLLVVSGSKLKRVVQAKQRDARPLEMAEVAAIARSSCRYDVLTSRLWRYQDCELDEDALNALVQTRRDELFESELNRRVKRDVDQMTQNLRQRVSDYADALKAAGVTPPDWMLNEELHGGWGTRNAADWVRDHVKPGPNQKELAAALAELADFRRTTERLTGHLTRAVEDLQESAAKAEGQLRKMA